MRSLLLWSSILLVEAITAQRPAEAWPAPPKWEFAISLGSQTTGQLFSLFVVKVTKEGQVLESQPLDRPNFIRQVQGRAFSKANPEAENLFRKHGVVQCLNSKDSTGFVYDCLTLDELWKLRFWEYPLKLQDGQHEQVGWAANKLRPDDRQLLLLSGYGMRFMQDLCIGDNMFRLLRDMGDPDWVNNYRNGS